MTDPSNATSGRQTTRPQSGTLGESLFRLRRPAALTRAGMVAERAARAFWPLWSVLLFICGLLAFGVQDALPAGLLTVVAAVGILAVASLGMFGLTRFRWPSRAEALDRLDRTLPGRPITALTDTQAIGSGDRGSTALWRAHLARMAMRVSSVRPVPPDLRLAARDPFALRYVALTAAAMALLFGSLARVATVADIVSGAGGQAIAAGPAWEGWIEPPGYTGRTSIYLNEVSASSLRVPEGSTVTLRLYGEVGALTVEETVSERGDAPNGDASKRDTGRGDAGTTAGSMSDRFTVIRDGALRIVGSGGREWQIATISDAPPKIAFDGEMLRESGGRARQDFRAEDDYGVTGARARITLDLDAVERRHGLVHDPEPRDALLVDLPLPVRGDRTEFAESLIDDLSEHPWANLPVQIRLSAVDAAGGIGEAERSAVTLPGRRFFDPFAAALIEMRRDLLWTRDTAPRVAQILRAVSHRPDEVLPDGRAYLQLRHALRQLETGIDAAAGDRINVDLRDEIATALWELAVQIEEGDLASALERLRRAQDRLSEAIRNGADESEIAELMQDLREAMQDYIRQLAEQSRQDGDRQQADNQDNMQELSGDQLEQMLQRLQELMEQGRMAEAAELLEQLRQMMENLQVTEGEGGQGQQGAGQQALRDLADTLRQQQGLSDDAFSDLQQQFGPGMGEPGSDGREPGDQAGREGENGERPGSGQGSLADRQQALREQLRRQQEQGLPFAGTEQGRAAEDALDEAGRAMEEAERALRDEDIAGALDRQSDAMEALRDGLRNLGEAMAQDQRRGDGRDGQALGAADPSDAVDPLGRSAGQTGRIGTDENLLQGEDVYRRAQELLDEIRRRTGDQTRPELERDYLRRLLDRF